MKKATIFAVVLMLLGSAVPAAGQHHQSNWVHHTAMDTTILRCWTDSLTWMAFPPSSMNMMLMPDSVYMRIDLMDIDSLHIPHDSTFIGWCRVQAGRDSMRFDMMNSDSVHGSRMMMQFMMGVRGQFRWDSLMADSMHRHWHPTGMRGWNGSAWVIMGGTASGNMVSLSNSQVYSAYGFVGTSTGVLSVTDGQLIPGEFQLQQNYPNPFNPSTTIRYSLPSGGQVTLKIFNVLGQEVRTLVNGYQAAGTYSAVMDARGLASGVYLYRLQSGSLVDTKRLVLLR